MKKPRRPVMRYPGSKWKIASWVIKQFPPHKHYIEPYGGSGSVLLKKLPVKHEVLNDLDDEVINVFRVLQNKDNGEELIRRLTFTPFSRKEYYLTRELSEDPIEQARRTIARTFMGFGTTGAFKQMSGFKCSSIYENRSAGDQWADLPESLNFYIERLRRVVIECRPAIEVILQQDHEDTLFYVDPPYVRSTRWYEDIYKHEMTDEEHVELAEVLHEVKGMVMISGYDCELYRELYKGWRFAQRDTTAAAPSGDNHRTETLWFSPSSDVNKYPLFTKE